MNFSCELVNEDFKQTPVNIDLVENQIKKLLKDQPLKAGQIFIVKIAGL